jgi:hypothetical protein
MKYWDDEACSDPKDHELCSLEDDRAKAHKEVREINNGIPNSYVGNVATMDEILSGKISL